MSATMSSNINFIITVQMFAYVACESKLNSTPFPVISKTYAQ